MNQESPKYLIVLFLAVFTPDVCAAGDSPEVHDDSRVTFRVAAPKADNVLLLGDWLKPGEALWEPSDVPHGNVEINFHLSKTLGDTRWFSVYTPPAYHKNTDKRRQRSVYRWPGREG